MYKTDTDLSDDTIRQKYLQMFPGVLNQQDDSTNARILNIIADLSIKYKNSLLSISDQVLIDNANGQTLTDIASDWGVNRIDDDDGFLRFQIRLQKMRGLVGITTNDLKQMVATAFGIDISSFDVAGTDNPEEIELKNVLVGVEQGPQIKIKYEVLLQSIQNILAPEYKLKDIQYAAVATGSLSFANYSTVAPTFNVKEDPITYRVSSTKLNDSTRPKITPSTKVREV
ncbi:hypothetical protein [Lentilactobacillus kosonis]|uniref:Uncharacterized protein n=1 Tax=Lentilactobacillus kosonis TaxID=2810561 RepID=A0A401FPU3_9LACO|nr:hypothetical protein [Lentilactobacillus kosonis]GAY74298.1 hypothetical protein NBRC111893_2444 [Lentilactobacillus kosonis]